MPHRRKALLLQAAALLAAARLMVLVVPFRLYGRWLGRRGVATDPLPLPVPAQRRARDVGWAVTTAAAQVPWRAECLPQAIVAGWMLHSRKVPTTLYLGAAKSESGLLLHAWLRAGDVIVTGKSRTTFAVVATFAG